MIIRDPIHGDIALDNVERAILDTPQMQRLRGIKQTGTAYLVYPGCVHTRFEHSLGVYHVTRKVVASLRRNGYPVAPEQERTIAASALVHDVSHLPFGHTFEDERKLFGRHDSPERLRHFLTTGELGQILRQTGLRDTALNLLVESSPNAPPWMREVIASTVDADLLDYLRRDAYFAGLSQDYDDRIFQYFVLAEDHLAMMLVRRGMERPDARTEILNLLRLRYFLTERVYFHHTKIISGAMIAKAVELAVERGLKEADLYELTDYTLFETLRTYDDPSIRRLIDAVSARALYKRAFVVSGATLVRKDREAWITNYARDATARRAMEAEIARAANLPAASIILSCPDHSAIKEANVYVVTRQGLRRLNETPEGPPADVRVLENQYEALWKLGIFCPSADVEPVARAAERVIGLHNELERPT